MQIIILFKNSFPFFFFFKVFLKIFFLFLAVLGLRFCARAFSSCGKEGHSSSRCAGLSLSRPLLLQSTGSRRAGSVVVAHGPSCSAACGILPDQGSNPRVPCIGRQILNHCATREAPFSFLNVWLSFGEKFLELVRSMWLLSF